MKKVIYLSGGFGNQLFQMLAAIHLSNFKNRVFIDTTLVDPGFVPEKLLRWKVHGNFVTEIFENQFEFGRRSIILVAYDFTLLFLSKIFMVRLLSHKYFHTQEYKINKDVKINMGYFQNLESYSSSEFKSYLGIFEKLISTKKLEDRTVIHFRGGDSLWAQEYLLYYTKVFDIAQIDNIPITIVTDDELYCKKLLQDYDFEYSIVSNNALVDFEFLSSSKTIFTAPSTFSWWAAILMNDKKKIYMPKFFQSRYKVSTNIIYL